jgi:hypothetical protein
MDSPFRAISTMSGVLLLSLQSVVPFQPVPRPTHTYNDVFDPTHQREMTASKDGVRLFVPACSKCAAVPTVIVNERKAVALADSLADLGQIDELHIIDATKAFVIGRSSNDTSHVILLDLVNGSVVDLSMSLPRVSAAVIGASSSIVECSGEFRGKEIDAYSVRDIEFRPNKLHLSFTHHEWCKGKKDATDVDLQ